MLNLGEKKVEKKKKRCTLNFLHLKTTCDKQNEQGDMLSVDYSFHDLLYILSELACDHTRVITG